MSRDVIRFNDIEYPTRDVPLSEYKVTVKVSTEELDRAIFDEESGYVSRDAELIDEIIFMYIPAEMMDASDEELDEYISAKAWGEE